MEVSTGIANLYVDTGEMEKASACYEVRLVCCKSIPMALLRAES